MYGVCDQLLVSESVECLGADSPPQYRPGGGGGGSVGGGER